MLSTHLKDKAAIPCHTMNTMNKHTIWTLTFLIILVVGISFFIKNDTEVANDTNQKTDSVVTPVTTSDPKSIAYLVDGETYTLVNGIATSTVAPDSASVNTLSMFGEPVLSDLDSDGDSDAAVLLTLETGGSGIFYYVALALNTNGVYKSTNTLFLGDRIAPQTLEVKEGHALFNYAERRADEPMTAQPSMAKSLWIQLDKATSEIGEWVKDFEGEVYVSALKLDLHPWTWVRTEYTNKQAFIPKKTGSFILTFDSTSNFKAKTDCNGIGGTFDVEGNSLQLGEMMSTLMYCDGSDEDEFSAMLTSVASYSFGRKGELLLKNEKGDMTMILQ